MAESFFRPSWPAPENVKSISTLRNGGISSPPYESFNLATHVGDEFDKVDSNRKILIEHAELPESPRWLNQIHSSTVIDSHQWQLECNADGMVSTQPNHVCCVMSADCLPVLICDRQGSFVAAVHAGWRGLLAGIIEKAIASYQGNRAELMVWLGPAIGPQNFEVGTEVYQHFTSHSDEAKSAFVQTDDEHFLANIYQLARQRIHAFGVEAVYGGEQCTVSNQSDFFSYRRDGVTGRMASMIWLNAK